MKDKNKNKYMVAVSMRTDAPLRKRLEEFRKLKEEEWGIPVTTAIAARLLIVEGLRALRLVKE